MILLKTGIQKLLLKKIDYILLYLNSKTQYAGEKIEYSYKDLINIFFIFDKGIDFTKNVPQVYEDQINFIRDCLNKLGYVSVYSLGCANGLSWNHKITFQLAAEGFKRIYELQKTQSNNKNAFVAMKFGDETSELREKLKEGIREAGYEPIIMDEIKHNHQIVPEMLYQIKNSKFLIAEFSHHNNGAYYEAGYALGLGKEVIHICKKSELTSGLHFDVAQVNTIVYDNIEEFPAKIVKRIKATIG